jgi:hypothetical protein
MKKVQKVIANVDCDGVVSLYYEFYMRRVY